MMRRIAFSRGALLLAAAFGMEAAGHAQCRLCDAQSRLSSQDEASVPVELEVESTLNFDRLVQMRSGGGTATLTPDGTRVLSGSLGELSGSAMVGSAVVRGEPGRMIRIELPRFIELHSFSGSRLVIDDIVTDLPSTPRLDSNGRLSFRFGGRLKVNGEAGGDYRGELSITADYL